MASDDDESDTPTPQPVGYSLSLTDIDTATVRAVRSPQVSVLTAICDVGNRRRRRRRGELIGPARQAIGRAELAGAHAVAAAHRFGMLFDSAAPILPEHDVSVAEQAAAIREQSRDTLRAEIRAMLGPHPRRADIRAWREPIADPHAVYQSLASASTGVWSVIEPYWERHSAAFDREFRRIGLAAVRGRLDLLLNSLHPKLSYRDGVLTLANDTIVSSHELGDRTLALVPVLSDDMGLVVSFDLPGVAYLAYPLPPSPAGADADDPDDALATILGKPRALVLRALSRPTTAGDLAAAVNYAANTVSYHCEHLERAGLLRRRRIGQAVEVRRTLRGDELVELLG